MKIFKKIFRNNYEKKLIALNKEIYLENVSKVRRKIKAIPNDFLLATDITGMTPLMNAIKVKNVEILDCILKKTDKDSLTIVNRDGDTALHYAIKTDDERIVERVLSNSPSKVHYIYNNEGVVPLTMSKNITNQKISEAVINDLNVKGITESLVMYIQSNEQTNYVNNVDSELNTEFLEPNVRNDVENEYLIDREEDNRVLENTDYLSTLSFAEAEPNTEGLLEDYNHDIFDNFSIRSNENNPTNGMDSQRGNENIDDFTIGEVTSALKNESNNNQVNNIARNNRVNNSRERNQQYFLRSLSSISNNSSEREKTRNI